MHRAAGGLFLRITPKLDLLEDLLLLGETPLGELGEDQLAVGGDLEAPAVGRQEHQLAEVELLLLQDRGRQTDGLGFVASGAAVLDLDLVDHPLSFLCLYGRGRPESGQSAEPSGSCPSTRRACSVSR